MAKRFIDTDLFKKQSVRGLQGAYKLLYIYLITDCNHAGIWDVDLDVASIRLGFDYSKQEAETELKNHIIVFDGGGKWFLPGFIEHQYGELSENNRVHKSVIDLLNRHNLLGKNKPLTSPLQGVKDKDKDMDKDMDKVKDKDKDKDKDVVMPFESLEFLELWGLWKDYKKREHNFRYKTVQSEQAALSELAKLSAGIEQAATEIIHQSLSNGWKGFFELKKQNNNATKQRTAAELMPTPEELGLAQHSKYRHHFDKS